MRYIFALWAAPMALFWGWFYLSLNDMNFGYLMLSRKLHDFVFELYGQMLGIDPAIIPGMVAKACVFDGCLLMALWAFRRRREITSWIKPRWAARSDRMQEATAADPKLPAE